MSFRDKIRGALIEKILGEGLQKLKRDIHKRNPWREKKITFFHDMTDYHSHLLLEYLTVQKEFPLDIDVVLIPGPTGDYDLVPDLRKKWNFRDAKILTSFWDLKFSLLNELEKEPHIEPQLLAQSQRIFCALMKKDIHIVKLIGAALLRGDEKNINEFEKKYGAVSEKEKEKKLSEGEKGIHKKGHYQGGMLYYEGEWYWGIDRFHYLSRRLKEEGIFEGTPLVRKKDPMQKELQFLKERPSEDISIDFYFSFRSPYSYLAIDRILLLEKKYNLKINIRPVLPMVMRGLPVPAKKGMYIALDTSRIARDLGIPFGCISDPVGKGVENCMALYSFAVKNNLEREFIKSTTKGCWSEGLNLANENDLKKTLTRIGLDFQKAKPLLQSSSWKEMTDHNQSELNNLGLWGVPSFNYRGIHLWGQDRIDILEFLIQKDFS